MLENNLSWLNEYRSIIHLILHAVVPFAVAYLVAIKAPNLKWAYVFMVLMATMAVDIDHLVADPIYAPGRCSIWFHPLHTLWPMVLYGVMTVWPVALKALKKPLSSKHILIGLVGLGLVIHMVLDWIDCLWMRSCG